MLRSRRLITRILSLYKSQWSALVSSAIMERSSRPHRRMKERDPFNGYTSYLYTYIYIWRKAKDISGDLEGEYFINSDLVPAPFDRWALAQPNSRETTTEGIVPMTSTSYSLEITGSPATIYTNEHRLFFDERQLSSYRILFYSVSDESFTRTFGMRVSYAPAHSISLRVFSTYIRFTISRTFSQRENPWPVII